MHQPLNHVSFLLTTYYSLNHDCGARHTGLKNLIEEKSKQIVAATENLYQEEFRDYSDRSSKLEKEISSLQQAELMSEKEENRFQQMKMNLESKKQELGIFKIVS
ncbi:hypothetical protein LIER_40485 [Lithospermum erythrorhizon]|uniref:Uncharacterized protein n=1 Tax=Lithospermum erythrorhizon TaxID=34254 RepID=A0AAV3QZK7_LITER